MKVNFKVLFFVLTSFLSMPCFAQNDSSCAAGTAAAKADAGAGKLKIIINAFPEIKNFEVDSYSFRRHTLDEILEQMYGITYEYKGTSYNAWYTCYNHYMDSVLDARFGEDLDERCQKTVDSMNALEQQNALKFYGTWDRAMDSLLKFKSFQCDSMTGKMDFKLEIDASGRIKSVTVTESFCPRFESKIINTMKSLRWTPATGIVGRKKESTGIVRLFFDAGKIHEFDVFFN